MTRKNRSAAGEAPADAQPRKRPLRILLVDREPQLGEVLRRCAPRRQPVEVIHAPTLAQARQRLADQPIDLAMIEPDLPDGSGLDLADELSRGRRTTQTIVISEKPSLESAIAALRAGACDFVPKPLDLDDLNQRVRAALHKRDRARSHAGQVRRLRRLCKKLNQARHEVSQQVDILCNDLVTAYQELACQMNQVVQTSEYGIVIRDELDLEQVLRRTLEYLVDKAGPTNAAIFLPSSIDEYGLGGYVNYDCTPQSADMLLQHLADVMAPRVAEADGLVHLTDNQTLDAWIADDAAWLHDSHLLAFACRHDDEPLAVIALFRDGGEPFDDALVETCEAIGPMLGEALTRLIRIHHRHMPDAFFEDDDGGALL